MRVAKRRSDLGMTQADLAAAGGISLATVQAIEAGRAGTLRSRTASGLEKGLAWSAGSAARVLRGDDPEEASDPNTLGKLAAALVPVDRQPMALIYALQQQDRQTPGAVDRVFRRLTESRVGSVPEAYSIVEGELGWPAGSIAQMLTAVEPKFTMPSALDALMRMHESWPGIRPGLPKHLPDPDSSLAQQVATGELGYDDVSSIAMSGLPKADMDRLAAWVAQRRRRFNEQLSVDLGMMIEAIKSGPSIE